MRSPNSLLDNKLLAVEQHIMRMNSSALDNFPIARDHTAPGTMHKQNIFDVIDINDDDDLDDDEDNKLNNDSLLAANLLL